MNPAFYDAKRCGTLCKPDLAAAAAAGKALAKQGMQPASRNSPTILVSIDNQIDFISPSAGNLVVPGAVEDTNRLNQFIFRNLEKIDRIVASLDTHYLYQPFHPCNWVAGPKPGVRLNGTPYQTGDNPDPFEAITRADVKAGKWLPAYLPQRLIEMLEKLETAHKRTLIVWPLHCILGSPGHALDPTFMETIFFHSAARTSQYTLLEKGRSQSSEHYGILKAEVEFSDDKDTRLNVEMLQQWENAGTIFFAGQAKSHCVLETLNQVVDFFKNSPDVLKRLYVLSDATSSVQHPSIDFESMANARFVELAKLGVNFIKTTDDISGIV